jgi:hypothetical protein
VPHLDLQLRVLEPGDADPRHLREREALGEEHGLELGDGAVAGEERPELGQGAPQHLGGEAKAAVEVLRAAPVDQQVVARDVLDQQAPVAVVDQAARRLDRELAQAVVLGQLAVVLAVDDLDEPEADGDRHEQGGDDRRHDPDAPDQVGAMLSNYFHV